MGSGLSQQQQDILAILKRRRRNPLWTVGQLATTLGGDTDSRRVSVRRALYSLDKRGLVELHRVREEHDLAEAKLNQLGRYGVSAHPIQLLSSESAISTVVQRRRVTGDHRFLGNRANGVAPLLPFTGRLKLASWAALWRTSRWPAASR